MTRRSPIAALLALSASAVCAACASSPGAGDLCGITAPPTQGWTAYDEGDFTVQLPPDFARVSVQGIDSRVGRWEAAGKQVSYDLGMYANRLQPDDLNPFPGLVVCQEGDGRDTPRIVRYSPSDGGHVLAAHWAGVRSLSPGMAVSLTLEGTVQAEEDLGELLAIVRSVRVDSTDTDDAGNADVTSGATEDLTASGAGPALAGDPGRPGYRAGGNEPFWMVTFVDTAMQFTNLGNPDTVRAPRPEAERVDGGWRFSASADGSPFTVTVLDERCSDSMSGRPFPHTVAVSIGGQTFHGCGGATENLLTGEEWRVVRIETSEVSGAGGLTLLFAADGTLTGNGGCNRFRATYELTGEGIGIGAALATRRACADPAGNAQETRFFSLLEQVNRFDFAEDGSLELLANDRPIIVARR